MRAARLWRLGEPLRIEDVPEPELRPGSAIVRVLSAFVAPYVAEMVEGSAPYILPPLPFTPGMDTIGVVEETADDVNGLAVGEKVFCDHYYTSGNLMAESCYIGAFGKSESSRATLAWWRDGSYAEKVILPAECFTPLREAESVDPARLCRLGWFGTCYGGLLRGGFRPGQTVVINGATGLVGASGVLLCLAMGAGRIVAVGRKEHVLEDLQRLEPNRVISVKADGEVAPEEIAAAAKGGAGIVLDAVGDITDPNSTMNAVHSLGPFGVAVFLGGLNAELQINYKWVLDKQATILGSSWFPRWATEEMLGMIGAGALNMECLRTRTFGLEKVNDAAKAAATDVGGLEHVALIPLNAEGS